MKTAISLPDQTFERVTRQARLLGISRSELFAKAAVSYLDTLDQARATEEIDRSLAAMEPDDSDHDVSRASRTKLAALGDEW